MEIGGSQLNAVELGAGVRDLGHEVLVVSEPGPMVDTVHKLGLEHVLLPMRRRRPSPQVIKLLVEQTRRRKIDVVHGHEWPPAVEAFLGPLVRLRVPAVATVMSAAVAPFLPRRMPLIVGTEQLRRQVLADGHLDATLIQPPVDLQKNNPAFDPGGFRAEYGLARDRLLLVTCCRLVQELKLEGLLAACDAIGELVREGYPVELAIVGDGEARPLVVERAARANARAGRPAIVLTGELRDPRPAYAAADVVLGMGGSGLRGMAFGKPLVVQGELAFWKTCRPDTAGEFLAGGWYGRGRGDDGVARLKAELRPLLDDAGYRASVGAFSQRLVVDNFGLAAAARIQLDIYQRVTESGRGPGAEDLARLAAFLTIHKVRRRIQRFRGRQTADDFNTIRAMRSGG